MQRINLSVLQFPLFNLLQFLILVSTIGAAHGLKSWYRYRYRPIVFSTNICDIGHQYWQYRSYWQHWFRYWPILWDLYCISYHKIWCDIADIYQNWPILETMVQPFAKNLILCSKLVYASAIQFLDSNLDLRITFIQLQTFPSDHNFRLAASRKMLQPKGTVPHRDQNQIILLLINQIQRKVQRWQDWLTWNKRVIENFWRAEG